MTQRTAIGAAVSTIRYPAAVLAGSLVFVLAAERVLTKHSLFIAGLSHADRTDLYGQFPGTGGSLLGFLMAAVAILVSLDRARPIVEELHRGEAFSQLVVNILAGCLWLLVLCGLGLVGSAWDPASYVFRAAFETLTYAALVELAIGGFFFGLVVFRVGTDKRLPPGTRTR